MALWENTSPDQTYIFDGRPISRGAPLPLGATTQPGGINFAVFSRHATHLELLLYHPGSKTPYVEIPLDSAFHRTGDVWHIFLRNLTHPVEYAYRASREPNPHPHIHRYNPKEVLVDPHARILSGADTWWFDRDQSEGQRHPLRLGRVVPKDFTSAFHNKRRPPIPVQDLVLYELHVRGFTRHPSSQVKWPGTFAGLVEKIPYLKELGVNAVELMPIHEFDESENIRINPLTGQPLANFWGYSNISFFAPKAAYAADASYEGPVLEFKEMVNAFHENGIEVILDVVFNHTAEGDESGPCYNFRGLDNATYYLLEPHTGKYLNFSGCGNTMNCNHPVVRELIIDSLRYWVMEMGVDGFRFDLASIMGRDANGWVLANPPVLERIAMDPVLAKTKLFAEAWDAVGLYQVGKFPYGYRFSEWNGHYRDEIRQFVKGEAGMVPNLAARLAGSPDLYQKDGRCPYHSVNFITCHDGFTLRDCVSYNWKHNHANGENNQDGHNENLTWNCGVEGETDDPAILVLRKRQQKNFVTLLFMSHGVPLFTAGDEFGRTQGGNNNAYCQDNEVSWVNWELLKQEDDLFRFHKLLLAFRREQAVLRPERFDQFPLEWHGVKAYNPDWAHHSQTLAVRYLGGPTHADLYLIANAYHSPLHFELPEPRFGKTWRRVLDTQLKPPAEISEPGQEATLNWREGYGAGERSCVVLIAK
jgi:isoamylase